MKTKTRVRAGAYTWNHNETLVRDVTKATTLWVKTRLREGGWAANHNETLVRNSLRKLCFT
jgi:hypothetical protein